MNDLAQHYSLLLGLNEDWLVKHVDLDLARQQVEIRLEYNTQRKPCCPQCGVPRPLKDHAEERTWRHLDTMQFQTTIIARIPRTHCPDCGVLNVHLPWAAPHGRFTLLFEAFAIRVLQASSSIEKGRKLLGLSWNSAQKIMSTAVERGLDRRDLQQTQHVGIDEKSFGRGHDYVSVLTDIDGQRVLEVAPKRTREAADSLWKTLPDKTKKQIKAVSMDMWAPFINSATTHVPQADIVHDRFHIAKHLNEAVDQVRRAEHKALKKEGDEQLTGTRYLWLTNQENLSEEQAVSFEALKEANLKTSRAWGIRELFREFFEQKTERQGRAFFKKWYRWASRCQLPPMVKVAQRIKEHFEQIVTWLTHRISNAPAEGFNSLIQALKSAARGFRNFENYRTRILFFCGKLKLFPEALRE